MLIAAEVTPFPTMSPMAGEPDAKGLLKAPILTAKNLVKWSNTLIASPRRGLDTPANTYIKPINVKKKERRINVNSEWNPSISLVIFTALPS